MILYPHCKINLGLSITGKREDGFHELSSIFYPVYGLTDVLEIIPSEESQFSSSGLEIDCTTEKNLCYRAYELLRGDYNIGAVKIHLHKVVPMGAGLGGGSSDATFVLKALSELFSLGLATEKLKEYSLMLGSDTPFFLYKGAMEVSGRGDILSPSPLDLGGWHITIIKPDIYISTREAFSGIKPKAMDRDIATIVEMSPEKWQEVLVNDFERHIFELHPRLQEIKESLLSSGAIYASMSGSGSSIYGISRTELEVETLPSDFIYQGTL